MKKTPNESSEFTWMVHYFLRKSKIKPAIRSWRKEIHHWRRFWRTYWEYKALASPEQQPDLNDLYPCLGDDTGITPIEPIYYYQDAWAFERIVKQKPASHVDIGSHHKFVALLSKVVPLTMVDIRPPALPLETVLFHKGSILELPYPDNTLSSVSSLCVIEHIGLGRYGDPLDPQGSEKAIEELKRVMAPGGNLYISIPVDDESRTHFNAHRVFSESYFLQLLSPMQLIQARYICGKKFLEAREPGFTVGCFHFKNCIPKQ